MEMTTNEESNDFSVGITESGFTLNATDNYDLSHTADYYHKHLTELTTTMEPENKDIENDDNINLDDQSIAILRYYVEGVILLPVSMFGLLGRFYYIKLYDVLT